MWLQVDFLSFCWDHEPESWPHSNLKCSHITSPCPTSLLSLPSPPLLGLGISGVFRGLRGMMTSSALTPSSLCFSDTWVRSSDWFGEKRLQHLHMKMAVFSVRKKIHIVISLSHKQRLFQRAKIKIKKPTKQTESLYALPSASCTLSFLHRYLRRQWWEENSFHSISRLSLEETSKDLPVTQIGPNPLGSPDFRKAQSKEI